MYPDSQSHSTPFPEFEVSIDPSEDTSHIDTEENTSISNLSNIQGVHDHPISPAIRDITAGVCTLCQESSNFCMFMNFFIAE